MIPKEIEGYDWEQAFRFCIVPNVSPVIESSARAGAFSRADVMRVVAVSEGVNDEYNWLCVVELNDGRFAFVSAGCDFTGWDCQASGYAMVDTDLQHLIRFGLGDNDRARLGLVSEAP